MSWDTDSFALKTRRTLRQVGENLTRLQLWRALRAASPGR
jgi:hypothetical protein